MIETDGGRQRPTPPASVRSVLRRIVPGRLREEIMTALDDAFRADLDRYGELGASLRYCAELFSPGLFWLCWESRRSASVGEPARRAARLPGIVRDDVSSALRQIVHRPTTSLSIGLLLALCAASTAALWALADARIWNPVPYPRPDTLHAVQVEFGRLEQSVTSWPDLRKLSERAVGLSIAGGIDTDFVLTSGRPPRNVVAGAVSEGFFEILGVELSWGRDFTPEEYSGATPVAVLTHDAATAGLFPEGTDPVGRSIGLDGREFRIVGVLPATFRRPRSVIARPAEIYVPMVFLGSHVSGYHDPGGLDLRGHAFIETIARRRSGVTIAEADRELAGLVAGLTAELPEAERSGVLPSGASLVALRDELVPHNRVGVRLATALVIGLVTIIGLSLLQLTALEAAVRAEELRTRHALGASRWRLVGPWLGQGLLLALAGGALGVGGASFIDPSLLDPLSGPVGKAVAPEIGAGSALAALAITATLSTLVHALPLILSAVRRGCRERRRDSVERPDGRSVDLLVAGQIAIAVMLLVISALVVRSVLRIDSADPGLDVDGLYFARLLGRTGGAGDPTADPYVQLRDIKAVAGVRSASLVSEPPLSPFFEVAFVGTDVGDDAQTFVRLTATGPGYFDTAGVEILAGRDFDVRDGPSGTTVALLNETLATALFPEGAEIEETPEVTVRTADGTFRARVVGVVEDTRQSGTAREAEPEIFLSLRQGHLRASALAIRADPDVAISALLAERQSVSSPEAASAMLAHRVRHQRGAGRLLAVFAAVGLLQAAVSLHASLARTTCRRAREIGIRRALGAGRTQLARLMTGRIVRLTAAGAAVGCVFGGILTRTVPQFLCGATGLGAADVLLALTALTVGVAVAILPPLTRLLSFEPVVALDA